MLAPKRNLLNTRSTVYGLNNTELCQPWWKLLEEKNSLVCSSFSLNQNDKNFLTGAINQMRYSKQTLSPQARDWSKRGSYGFRFNCVSWYHCKGRFHSNRRTVNLLSLIYLLLWPPIGVVWIEFGRLKPLVKGTTLYLRTNFLSAVRGVPWNFGQLLVS